MDINITTNEMTDTPMAKADLISRGFDGCTYLIESPKAEALLLRTLKGEWAYLCGSKALFKRLNKEI